MSLRISRDMKIVRPGRARIVHVETPLGIVNIYVGLTDIKGRRVEAVEMIPNEYAGEPKVKVVGRRFIETHPPYLRRFLEKRRGR